MNKIKVNLGKRSYYIYIGYNILSGLSKMLKDRNGMVITDNNVIKYWGKEIRRLKLPVYSIAPGERSKTLKTAEKIYKEMLKNRLDRKSYLIAFGGGVVGDLTGYVAATYMRGIRYIQVPTTLMAQVDSSIGGKTGVNLPQGKNLIGCFWQPDFVYIDIKLLKTLPLKELKSGLAEVIKYGVIRDRDLFKYLENAGRAVFKINPDLWEVIIVKCAKIKADIAGKDERETKGKRTILNYGHTVGHAIESSEKYKGITHGEAVSIGMIAAAKLSNLLGVLDRKDKIRQIDLINTLVSPRKRNLSGSVINRIKYDKKMAGGRPHFVLAKKIGNVFVTSFGNDRYVRVALKRLWQT